MLTQPESDVSMNSINLVWCRSFPSPYGPNRFISYNNIQPLFRCNLIGYSLEHFRAHLLGMAHFIFNHSLPDANNSLHAIIEGLLGFLAYDQISFLHDMPPL